MSVFSLASQSVRVVQIAWFNTVVPAASLAWATTAIHALTMLVGIPAPIFAAKSLSSLAQNNVMQWYFLLPNVLLLVSLVVDLPCIGMYSSH